MYYLQSSSSRSQYEPKISKGSVPHLKIKDLTDVIVPVPPLPVQEEIVRILDTFTELTTELTTELMKRKEQYLYYRNKLLCFDDVKFLKLKETCTNEGWKSYSK